MSATIYECEVLPADDFIVSWGINEGDQLGPPETCALGDVYRLTSTRHLRRLTLRMDDRITVLRDHSDSCSDTGQLPAGVDVTPLCQMRLMAQDGDLLDMVLLMIGAQRFALPLGPIRPAVNYALIDVNTDDTGFRLSEIVQGCFGAGTRITTADGSLVPIEQIEQGCMVLTRDHGAQPVRWIGKVTLRRFGDFAPVVIPAAGLGNLRSLHLAPRQRIFLYQRGDKRLGARAEILLQARQLVGSAGITQPEGGFVTYYSLAFDEHQIIYAEGVPMESLLVSRATLTRLPATLCSDLKTRFPHLHSNSHFAQDLSSDTLSGAARDTIFSAYSPFPAKAK
ncbi:Hint domain-containing protein [Roseinatronobacter alkalisoli]|uniref:Hint domain-containing protein n=1 Tax=Roseinatronobacter alkalisoli TaxID=3028235 RepID=A0ABT5TEJ8_9RHOB|nr:Hint domain-containing protein [Roseinatronobacter sp. HJB301]MDD7972602.1 Hint domain-containing protein [Roseinatronobacter sp. HJB301]